MSKVTIIPNTPNAKMAIETAVRDTPRWRAAVLGVRFSMDGDFLVLKLKKRYNMAPPGMLRGMVKKIMEDNGATEEEYTTEVELNG